MIWPLADHYITRDFDYKSSIYIGGQHAAVDLVRLQGDTLGRGILAVAGGVVVKDTWDKYSGYFIALDHAGGWHSRYRHLVADAPPAIGQTVTQGQVIGNVGSTGLSTGPHLHFDLWHLQKQDNTAFSKSGWWAHNPELYLGKEDDMTPEEMQAACEAALDAKASELRKWAKRGGWDAIDDKLPAIVAAIVKAMPSGGTWTEAQLVTVMKGGLKR
ncbi:hypothetical protein LCGC14_3031800, partial [marine sediment metagenome]